MIKPMNVLSIALVGLFGLSSSPAFADGSGNCSSEYSKVVDAWNATWTGWPNAKPGHSMVEDAHGHRHTIVEYESMLRRLRHGRDLCAQQDSADAIRDLHIVRSWLNADNHSAQMIGLIEPE